MTQADITFFTDDYIPEWPGKGLLYELEEVHPA
jgi:hypothetical protein